MKIFITLFLILLTAVTLLGQSLYQPNSDEKSYKPKFDLSDQDTKTEISTSNALTVSVNPKEYIIDAGDIFIIKIDQKGPALKVFNSPVTPDGFILLPDVAGIYVKDLTLEDAKNIILGSLKNVYKDAQIEAYLFSIHPIHVTVLGATQLSGTIPLLSTSRIFDAYKKSFFLEQPDSITQKINERISLRFVKLVRNDSVKIFDLLRFIKTGITDQNPYLKNDDVIYFSFKDSTTHFVSVKGAVGNPLEFAYKDGDKLDTAIEFAEGLLPSADSSKIELFRFLDGTSGIQKIELKIPDDNDFKLRADDRIYIRLKENYHEKASIEITGEVKFPGEYAIVDGKSSLNELINLAGGFTDKASLMNARVLRVQEIYKDKELQRLNKANLQFLNDMELSYMRLRTREDIRVVSCDFNSLFVENDSSQNIKLRNKDIIQVPRVSGNVLISGGVHAPGIVQLNTSWRYEDYIKFAGGYSDKAQEGRVKIIKHNTGNWLDADDDIQIEEDDVIFIPEREDYDYYEIFKDAVTITTQIATVILLYISATK